MIDGETILPSQAMALIKQTDPKDVDNPAPEAAVNPVASPLTPVAKQIDIREPVSGKWRVPKKQPNAEAPPAQQPAEASPKPSAVAAAPASKPPEAKAASQSNLPASPPAEAPPPAKVHSETALPAAERTVAKPKQKQNILMAVIALLGVMLVVLLALVLAFLL
jgi:cobalamin biosynthesis Mg chelatase CobN